MQRRIYELSEEIRSRLLYRSKNPLLDGFLHLDESTDVASSSKLIVFVLYIYKSNIKVKFLFCEHLESQTSGI